MKDEALLCFECLEEVEAVEVTDVQILKEILDYLRLSVQARRNFFGAGEGENEVNVCRWFV